MRTNYMMTVDDVMEELGVKRSKAYSILKQLNDELAKEGYVAVRGKIPRPYWETKFYVKAFGWYKPPQDAWQSRSCPRRGFPISPLES